MSIRTLSKTVIVLFITIGLFLAFPVQSSEAGGGGGVMIGCCSTMQDNGGLQPGSCLGCPDGLECGVSEVICDSEGGFFNSGESCEDIGPNFQCSDPGEALGCCVIPTFQNCRNSRTLRLCQTVDRGDLWVAGAPCDILEECEFEPVSSVPTLNQWGLIALAGILGIVGFIMAIRRNATA